MLTAARYASRLIESRSDITKRTFSSILQSVSEENFYYPAMIDF